MFVSPRREDWSNLPTKPTDGEFLVGDYFIRNLPAGWEVYFQPYLNGLRPDFVLLNPNVGIVVVEVKDWNPRALEYKVEFQGSSKTLFGKKVGESKWFRVRNNPFDRIQQYQREIFELYCPSLPLEKGFAAVTTAVIFTEATQAQLRKTFADYFADLNAEYATISGADVISEGKLSEIVPASRRATSYLMNEERAADLRRWLIEPTFSREQRTPLNIVLDAKQKDAVQTRTATGYRRIRGPAGSGKSLILAARAARLYLAGKRVLVVTSLLSHNSDKKKA